MFTSRHSRIKEFMLSAAHFKKWFIIKDGYFCDRNPVGIAIGILEEFSGCLLPQRNSDPKSWNVTVTEIKCFLLGICLLLLSEFCQRSRRQRNSLSFFCCNYSSLKFWPLLFSWILDKWILLPNYFYLLGAKCPGCFVLTQTTLFTTRLCCEFSTRL